MIARLTTPRSTRSLKNKPFGFCSDNLTDHSPFEFCVTFVKIEAVQCHSA